MNCKKCGALNLVKNRRICILCNRLRVQEYYRLRGKEKRKSTKIACVLCEQLFTRWRKEREICPVCYKLSQKTGYKNNRYIKIGNKDEHRVIAENILNRKLSYNEVVHHVDENPQNNNLENLWVMTRHHHNKLHFFLRIQRVVYEKSLDKNSVNCWNTLRVDQTTAWLEMANAKVIKLIELGNQQPSPFNGEGPETRHGMPEQIVLKAKV